MDAAAAQALADEQARHELLANERIAELEGLLREARDELVKHGKGDFHYGPQPQDHNIVDMVRRVDSTLIAALRINAALADTMEDTTDDVAHRTVEVLVGSSVTAPDRCVRYMP